MLYAQPSPVLPIISGRPEHHYKSPHFYPLVLLKPHSFVPAIMFKCMLAVIVAILSTQAGHHIGMLVYFA